MAGRIKDGHLYEDLHDELGGRGGESGNHEGRTFAEPKSQAREIGRSECSDQTRDELITSLRNS